jgi:hypothetical protein
MSTNIVFIPAIATKQNPDSAIQAENSVAIADGDGHSLNGKSSMIALLISLQRMWNL